MSEIYLSPFSLDIDTREVQCAEAVAFFHDQSNRRAYEDVGREQTVFNYTSMDTALPAAKRLALAQTIEGGLIRAGADRDIVGTWTMNDNSVMKPGSAFRKITGTQIDYAAVGVDETDHIDIAEQLILTRRNEHKEAFALLTLEEEDLAAGIVISMRREGFRNRVRVPLARLLIGRHFGLADDDRPMQLFVSTVLNHRTQA